MNIICHHVNGTKTRFCGFAQRLIFNYLFVFHFSLFLSCGIFCYFLFRLKITKNKSKQNKQSQHHSATTRSIILNYRVIFLYRYNCLQCFCSSLVVLHQMATVDSCSTVGCRCFVHSDCDGLTCSGSYVPICIGSGLYHGNTCDCYPSKYRA